MITEEVINVSVQNDKLLIERQKKCLRRFVFTYADH